MKTCEINALAGDLFSDGQGDHKQELEAEEGIKKGRVIDLMIPIICLIICCVIGMLYTGGFFQRYRSGNGIFQFGCFGRTGTWQHVWHYFYNSFICGKKSAQLF